MSDSDAIDTVLDNGEVEKVSAGEVHDASILDELLKNHTLDQEGKGVWLIFWKNDDGTWSMGWNKYIGTKPTDEVLEAKRPGEYALVGMAESAKEEVEKMEGFSFTTLPAGAELFTIKTVLEKETSEEDQEDVPKWGDIEKTQENFPNKEDFIIQEGEIWSEWKLPYKYKGEFHCGGVEAAIAAIAGARTGKKMTLTAEETTRLEAAKKACGIEDEDESEDETDAGTKYELAEEQGHTHTVVLDEKGTGTSTNNDEHVHVVTEKVVAEANGHTHKLTLITEDATEEDSAEDDTAEDTKDCGCKGKEDVPAKKDKNDTDSEDAVSDCKNTKKATFIDSVNMALDLKSAVIDTDKDTMTFKDIIVARPMVQVYVMGDEKVRVLKCPTELDKAQKYMDHRYVCDDHPLEQRVVSPDQIRGHTHDSKVTDAKELSTSLTITDATLKDKIDNGKRDVSIGFDCALDWKPGTFTDAEGTDHAYDAVQRNILINHVAIVDEGRCSLHDGCGIPHVDSATADAMVAIKSGIVNTLNNQVQDLTSQLATPIIDNILSITDKKSREDLSQMTLADLKEVESMLLDAKPADQPNGDGKPVNDTQKEIDKKFDEMGKNKKK